MELNDDDCAVKIAVRERKIRDSYAASLSPSSKSVISYQSSNSNILLVDQRRFAFDYAFQPTTTQSELFVNLVKPLVVKTLEGFNCTALAYGQTGTGKSYSMGLNAETLDGENVGVIPRCMEEIFNCVSLCDNPTSKEISASFIEIYNEKVYDLLGIDSNEQINVKGHKFSGGVRKRIFNIQDGYSLLKQGSKNRHVRPTKMNSQSSRSHAIFIIHIHQESGAKVTTSYLNLVDLAGSEGVRKTGHQGVALTEGVHINQGLLSIGKVLQALTAGNKVIPYRDSVLSSVLQDSLNSNSFLTLLACVSPHREDLSETLSTLRFAQNAKSLRHMPQINSIMIKKNKVKTPTKRQLSGIRPFWLSKNQNSLIKNAHHDYHSNTFSTPNKLRKIEMPKLNQTDVGLTPKDKLKVMVRRPLAPKFSGFGPILNDLPSDLNPIYNNNSNIIDSFESRRSSLLSINISTSTAVESQTSSYSPVVRKCMTEFENKLENKMQQMLGTLQEYQNLNNKFKDVEQTPMQTPIRPNIETYNNVQWNTLKKELRSIVREEILTFTEKKSYSEATSSTSDNMKLSPFKLFSDSSISSSSSSSSNKVFKVPEVPKILHSPMQFDSEVSMDENQTGDEMFAQFSNQTVIPHPKRRSRRINSMMSIAGSSKIAPCRRSLRLSIKTKDHVTSTSRRSSRLSSRLQSVKECTVKSAEKVKKKAVNTIASLNNKVIAAYFSENTNERKTPNKIAKIKHEKAILNLLNTGNIKELQILPQIGLKTAYQIITHRTLNGKFKNFAQVSKLPVWRGKSWDRFKTLNNIS